MTDIVQAYIRYISESMRFLAAPDIEEDDIGDRLDELWSRMTADEKAQANALPIPKEERDDG